jgi:hypothetical protein
MTIIKPWIQVILALALGFSLGLLTHQARAANVEADVHSRAFLVCVNSSDPYWSNVNICYMKQMPESEALQMAESLLTKCAVKECAEERAYIRQRWGY